MKKFLWLFLAPASASSLLAQTPAPVTPEVPRTTTTMLHAMSQAGPLVQAFDQLVRDWRNNGGDQIRSELQALAGASS